MLFLRHWTVGGKQLFKKFYKNRFQYDLTDEEVKLFKVFCTVLRVGENKTWKY